MSIIQNDSIKIEGPESHRLSTKFKIPKINILAHQSDKIHYSNKLSKNYDQRIKPSRPDLKILETYGDIDEGDFLSRAFDVSLKEFPKSHRSENQDQFPNSISNENNPVFDKIDGTPPSFIVFQDTKDYQSPVKSILEEKGENSNQEATNFSTQRDETIRISLFEYFRKCFTKDPLLKKKLEILNEGRKKIDERLDIFNIMKKLREIDKLKALLLDKDQLILFDNLPKPVIEPESRKILDIKLSTSHALLRKGTFIQHTKEHLMRMAKKTIENKKNKSSVDIKLLQIYEETLF